MSNQVVIDLCGLKCPAPIIQLNEEIQKIDVGGSMVVLADDPAFPMDADAWCTLMGHELAQVELDQKPFRVEIRKQG